MSRGEMKSEDGIDLVGSTPVSGLTYMYIRLCVLFTYGLNQSLDLITLMQDD